jgi:hypothetical protein
MLLLGDEWVIIEHATMLDRQGKNENIKKKNSMCNIEN